MLIPVKYTKKQSGISMELIKVLITVFVTPKSSAMTNFLHHFERSHKIKTYCLDEVYVNETLM